MQKIAKSNDGLPSVYIYLYDIVLAAALSLRFSTA